MWILVIIINWSSHFRTDSRIFYNRTIQKKIERGELKEAPPEIKIVDE